MHRLTIEYDSEAVEEVLKAYEDEEFKATVRHTLKIMGTNETDAAEMIEVIEKVITQAAEPNNE